MQFYISPAGYVNPFSDTNCFGLSLYKAGVEGFRGVIEFFFIILAFYYLVIEILKVVNSIKSERRKLLWEDSDFNTLSLKEKADKALDKGASNIKGIINGLLAHIKNMWNFLDVMSVTLSLIGIITWLAFLAENKVNLRAEKFKVANGAYQIEKEEDLENLH